MDYTLVVLYTITISVIGMLLYSLLHKSPVPIKIYNQMPQRASFETHHWGYGWRPWWRKYQGVPGLGKPLPTPEMPVATKPIVIKT